MNMKKLIIIIVLAMIFLSACTDSKTDIREDISNTYKNVTLVPFLENLTDNSEQARGVVLHYGNQTGSLYLYRYNYFLNLNSETTFIYNINLKTIQKYTDSLDETFQKTAEDIYDFINKVETEENIEIRKFDYLIYDAITEILLEANNDFVDYKTSRPNPGAFYPTIVIKSDNYDKFSKLNVILDQLNTETSSQSDISISLSKHPPLFVHLKIGSNTFDIEESINEDLTNRIILISSLI